MTTNKRIKTESKIRDSLNKCNTKEDLDKTAIELLNNCTDDAVQTLIVDNYLRISQRIIENKTNNTKSTNEYSWLDYDGLKNRETNDKEIGLKLEENNQ